MDRAIGTAFTFTFTYCYMPLALKIKSGYVAERDSGGYQDEKFLEIQLVK